MYGSSRLGMTRAPALPSQTIAITGGGTAYVTSFTRGLKSYELANHLGNVLATITDKKIGVSSDAHSSLIDHFTADLVTAQDYYPFGMIMPGRNYTAPGGANYRYGFNGQENENEIAGVGNHTTAEFWEYDPRIGRRWNIDPVGKEWESPYATFSNNPIARADPNGDSDTAIAFKAAAYQQVMDENQKKMAAMEPVIEKYQENIKMMKSLLNQKVLFDVGMSWNIFSWLPQMGSDAISGSDVDYMASQLAARIDELQDVVQKYNSAYTDYSYAAKSLKLEFQNATHLDIGGGVVLDRLSEVSKTAGIAGAMHLNSGAAQGSFAIYEIMVDGQTLKFGIADANRLRKGGEFAGLPERLAQQLSRIGKYAPELEVTFKLGTALQVTKATILKEETATILAHAKQFGIPLGNLSHIKTYAQEFGKGELSAKALQALSKFMKF